jgi:hypothetical protein
MQSTMDTDHELPAPMHRPFITLDSQYDAPLSFRRSLDQISELNAENCMPYTLPKERRLSGFERLPLEIRRRVYDYLGILIWAPNGTNMTVFRSIPCSITFFDYNRPWLSDNEQILDLRGVLGLTCSIRKEVLDTLFCIASARFNHHLSNRKEFRNNWANLYSESFIPYVPSRFDMRQTVNLN